ncbi:MAG TPA: hypothetical protein VEI97_14345 [bacterium]|nr:hypothetical protein [bacterium]
MGAPRLIDNRLTTFKIESRLPQWVVWPLVLGFLGLVLFAVEQYLHHYTITQVVPEITEVDHFGVVKQSTDFTCVPAALTTLLRHQGVAAEQREVTDRLGTTIFGTYPWMIPKVGRSYGFRITREKLGFHDLYRCEDPLLLYNHFNEGLHVSYVPPGRLPPDVATTVFAGLTAPLLPVMDPVDGLVLMDEVGFAGYFDSAEPKTVYRFVHPEREPRSLDLVKVFISGNSPLLKVGATSGAGE